MDDFNHRAGRKLDSGLLKTLVLLDIEQQLQSWEQSLQSYQLPVPTVEEVAQVQQQVEGNLHLPVVICENSTMTSTR